MNDEQALKEIRKSRANRRMTAEETATYLDEHGPVWELTDPPADKCCLCSCDLPDDRRSLWEWRRTGLNGKGQRWYYCLACWPYEDTNMEVKKNKFLQYQGLTKLKIQAYSLTHDAINPYQWRRGAGGRYK